jgi:hypothetical protein
MRHIAEMSLSLLSDDNLARLQRNGFVGMLPGIESWYDYGNKSRATRARGQAKVEQVADHVNRVLARIPFVQTNFILGLDCDEGEEPFALTREFLRRTPGAYPAFSLFTCYGRASPLNLDLQRAGRVNAMAFHFLDSNHGMNIIPRHYHWTDFYEKVAEVTRYAYGAAGIARRLKANGLNLCGVFNLFRGATTGRPKYQTLMARMLCEDRNVRAYFEGETARMPAFFEARVRRDLGGLWDALPPGALEHDPCAYLENQAPVAA